MPKFSLAPEDPLRQISTRAWLVSIVVIALIILAFWTPMAWMYERWILPDSYYSHGFFVPLVALYFVWRDRHRLLSEPAQPSLLGLAIMLVGLAILLISGLLVVYFTAAFGMILTLWGMCGFLFGRPALRRLVFPAFILTFMVPLPLSMIAEISLMMKLFATKVAIVLLGVLGVEAVNDGSTIYLENGAVVTVGNACSGLRSLISLIFLGVIFAYISDLGGPKKLILFLSSIPIAIVANIVRVFFMCLIANKWGAEVLPGTVHDTSGYLIFVVAFILLYLTARLLSIGSPSKTNPPETSQTPPLPKTVREEETHA